MCFGVSVSVDFTVRIPRRLAERMRRYRGVNWSEVVRRCIEEYLMKLEEVGTVVDASELVDVLVSQGVDPKDLEPRNYEEEVKYYRGVSS